MSSQFLYTGSKRAPAKRQCLPKMGLTREHAIDRAELYSIKQGKRYTGYFCEHCENYHVGKTGAVFRLPHYTLFGHNLDFRHIERMLESVKRDEVQPTEQLTKDKK